MAKPGNNEGSIYRRSSDGLYVAALTTPEGKRRAFYGKTRAEAASKLQQAHEDTAKGLPLPSARLTVPLYLEQWVESARPTLRPTTAEGYERTPRLPVIPVTGKKTLARLTPQDLAALYQKLLAKGLSPRSVQLAHAILHRALRQAERFGARAAQRRAPRRCATPVQAADRSAQPK